MQFNMRILKKLANFAFNHKDEVKKIQITYCYCSCGNELVSNHKECYYGEDSLVHYTCVCGKNSAWDFYAPAPLLIEMDGEC